MPGPPDQPGRGLVPGRGQEVDVVEDLLPGEAAHGPVRILELGLEELGHQVVGRVRRPPLDVLLEPVVGHRAVAELGVHVGHALLGQAQAVVDAVADVFLVGLGNAEQHADGAHGHLGAEVGDEVEPARAHQRIEAAGAELPDLGLEVVHLARREDPGEQAAMGVVHRGVLEDDRPGRDLHVALDDLEQGALARDVGLPVDRSSARRRRSG